MGTSTPSVIETVNAITPPQLERDPRQRTATSAPRRQGGQPHTLKRTSTTSYTVSKEHENIRWLSDARMAWLGKASWSLGAVAEAARELGQKAEHLAAKARSLCRSEDRARGEFPQLQIRSPETPTSTPPKHPVRGPQTPSTPLKRPKTLFKTY